MGENATCVVLLDPGISPSQLDEVLGHAGFHPGASLTRGSEWAAIAVGDGVRSVDAAALARLPGVWRVVPVVEPYRLASREVFQEDREVAVPLRGEVPAEAEPLTVGGRAPVRVMVSSRWATGNEPRLQLLAPLLREAGCGMLFAGRLSLAPGETAGTIDPDDLVTARDVAHEHGLAVAVEVSDAAQIRAVQGLADMLQVGSHSMQDFSLLREIGGADSPVLLRRGSGATVEEFLLAAEYVLSHGNGRLLLCESGIRTFDSVRKPRFEINAIPVIKRSTHLPLLADPANAAPHAGAVPAMARAAVAAGADGLVLEVGTRAGQDPEGAAVDIETLRRLMGELRPIARAVGRSMDGAGEERVEARPRDAGEMLRRTEATLAQTIEAVVGVPPDLEVVSQWSMRPPATSWLAPPLSPGSEVLGRCTSYRMGAVRLSRNISYVDLGRIDPTLAALLQTEQLNLGQLFVDPRIVKLHFEFGTHEDAGPIHDVFRNWFPEMVDDLHPYVWRRYHAAIGGTVTFVVIEALPTRTWDRLLRPDASLALSKESSR